MEHNMEVPQKTKIHYKLKKKKKLKIQLLYDPAIPFPGIYLDKRVIRKDTCIPMFTEALFVTAETWKNPVSINR